MSYQTREMKLILLLLSVISALAKSDPPNSLCPYPDGPDSVYLPHENCNKFYQCSNGIAIEMQCPTGTMFNPNLNVCDLPCNVNCSNKTPIRVLAEKSKTDFETTKVEPRQVKALVKGLSDAELGSIICSYKTEKFYISGHAFDCNKFVVCDGGSAEIHKCEDGLHFSPHLLVCIGVEYAGCKAALSINN